jgi:hypothetical protein
MLYIVAESDYDAYFYGLCAEWMTGVRYEVFPIKSRKRSGYRAVQNLMGDNLSVARSQARAGAEVCFLAGIDNDRAPHPENETMNRNRLNDEERNRPSRHDWMMATVLKKLGQNRVAWPLPVALAVPVEMIESWIIRSRCDAPLQPARYFSRADTLRAREFYESHTPPPQWKDLADEEQARGEYKDKWDFYFDVVLNLNPAELAARSLSFRLFKEWLDAWPHGAAPV